MTRTDIATVGLELYAALDAQDWPRVESLVRPDLVVQVGSSPPTGFDGWRSAMRGFQTGFPDGHHVIEEHLVDGDRFVTRCRFEGTHTGDFMAVPSTGAAVSVRVIHMDRFEDGLLAEHHGVLDMLGLMHQIGASAR